MNYNQYEKEASQQYQAEKKTVLWYSFGSLFVIILLARLIEFLCR